MRPSKRNMAIAGAGLVAALILSACGGADNESGGSMSGMNHGNSTSATGSGSTASSPGDVMFAQMMIPHHQQAIEMADLALQKDSASRAVTGLATKIKSAQDPEIETMTRWLRQWNAPATSSMGHGAGSGMMTDADMKELTAAKGAAFDRMWLTMMVAHHEGAIDMAQAVLETTTSTEVKQMAQGIIEGQNKEIATMRSLL